MARTNLSVDERVFEEFSYQAQKQNKTLFAFGNESLSVISKICAEGGTPAEIAMLWKVAIVLRQVDVMTLPADFLDLLIEKLYNTDKAWTLKMFGQLGASMVGFMNIAVGEFEQLGELAREFELILPIKKFDIETIDKNTIRVNVIGAGRKVCSTECSLEFLKELLNGFGWNVTQQEFGVGTIQITASKRGLP